MITSKLLKEIRAEFGFVNEGEESTDSDIESQVEKEVISKLDRSSKLDEVETVTFGLETDDGKIVKVYVKAEEANEFEKALSQKLGEVDDIEEALNELSKEFEIVDVDWPDDAADEKSADETADEEDDGSEAMDPRVYGAASGRVDDTAPTNEGLNFGELATLNLLEDKNAIESRLSTPAQLLVYHAILELGIPAIALVRNPYRAAIIKGIRDTAFAMTKHSSMKTALKTFVKKSTDIDEKDMDSKEEEDHKHGHVNEAISYLKEDMAQDYWETFNELIKYISPDPETTASLNSNTKLTQMITRSTSALTSRVTSDLRLKAANLVKAMINDTGTGAVVESATPDEVQQALSNMLMLADSSNGNLVAKSIIGMPQFKQFMAKVKTKLSQKFNGQVRTKFNQFEAALSAAVDQMMSNSKATEPTVAPSGPVSEQKILEEKCKWEFSSTDEDGLMIACGFLRMSLNDENREKLAKAISTHDAIVVKDDEGKKYVFSPRGVNLQVKLVGSQTSYMMVSADVDKLADLAGQSDADDDKEKVEDAEDGDTDSKKIKHGDPRSDKPVKKELDPHVAKKSEEVTGKK